MGAAPLPRVTMGLGLGLSHLSPLDQEQVSVTHASLSPEARRTNLLACLRAGILRVSQTDTLSFLKLIIDVLEGLCSDCLLSPPLVRSHLASRALFYTSLSSTYFMPWRRFQQ